MANDRDTIVKEIVDYLTRHDPDTSTAAKDRIIKETVSTGKELEKKSIRDSGIRTLFNDAIHGPVQLNSLLVKIVNTPEFQRLRLIKQLGGGCYVYPGANHKRFDHSIGVCHIAGEFGKFLKSQIDEAICRDTWPDKSVFIENKEILCLQIAGLCHDLGHGPFSHTFEQRVSKHIEGVRLPKHEELSMLVFDQIMKYPEVLADFVYTYDLKLQEVHLIKDMIHPDRKRDHRDGIRLQDRTRKEFLLEMVANKTSGMDVDKWDYFTRDCHYLGIAMDFQWKRCMLLGRVCKHVTDDNFHICFHKKELDNIYGMGRTRSTLYRKAYVHKTKVAVEEMFARAILEVRDVPLIPMWDPKSEDNELETFSTSKNISSSESAAGDSTPSNQQKSDDVHDKKPGDLTQIGQLQPINKAIESAAKNDLRWFLSMDDHSIVTFIKNWTYYARANDESYEKHKKSIKKAKKLLSRIDHRQLYHRIIVERVPRHHDLSTVPNEAGQEMIEWNITRLMTKFTDDKDKEKEAKRKQLLKTLGEKIFKDDASSAFVDIVSISFGSETKKDPVQDVLFYTAENPFTAIDWKSVKSDLGMKASSLALPVHFTEYEIRVYDTSEDSLIPAIQERLKETFRHWLDNELRRKPLLENESLSIHRCLHCIVYHQI